MTYNDYTLDNKSTVFLRLKRTLIKSSCGRRQSKKKVIKHFWPVYRSLLWALCIEPLRLGFPIMFPKPPWSYHGLNLKEKDRKMCWIVNKCRKMQTLFLTTQSLNGIIRHCRLSLVAFQWDMVLHTRYIRSQWHYASIFVNKVLKLRILL